MPHAFENEYSLHQAFIKKVMPEGQNKVCTWHLDGSRGMPPGSFCILDSLRLLLVHYQVPENALEVISGHFCFKYILRYSSQLLYLT